MMKNIILNHNFAKSHKLWVEAKKQIWLSDFWGRLSSWEKLLKKPDCNITGYEHSFQILVQPVDGLKQFIPIKYTREIRRLKIKKQVIDNIELALMKLIKKRIGQIIETYYKRSDWKTGEFADRGLSLRYNVRGFRKVKVDKEYFSFIILKLKIDGEDLVGHSIKLRPRRQHCLPTLLPRR